MTKITTKNKPADPTRINIDDAGEVTRWARHFGINEAQLKTFVQGRWPDGGECTTRDRTDPLKPTFLGAVQACCYETLPA
jgi:hypothetical protein